MPELIPFAGFLPIPQGDGTWQWMVSGDIVIELGKSGSGLFVTIPDGMVTDLASIPRWLHWLLNPFHPQTAEAAAGHDGLLLLGFEQRVAAGEFYRLLVKAGQPLPVRIAYYLAVVLASDAW